MSTAISAVVLLLGLWLQAPPQTGVIQGRAILFGGATAVAHARVVAAKVGGPVDAYRTTIADAEGHFVFHDLSLGSYRLYAQRDGYLQAEYGRGSVGTIGTPITIEAGRASPDVIIAMMPTGVIAGRVFDGRTPVVKAVVRALKATYLDGRRMTSQAAYAETDDRGEYRIIGLPPGNYVVSATPAARPSIVGETILTPTMARISNNNQRETTVPLTPETLSAGAIEGGAMPTVFYPGATDVDGASSVALAAGGAVNGIDIVLSHVPVFHVRGRVVVESPTATTLSDISVSVRGMGSRQQVAGASELGFLGPGAAGAPPAPVTGAAFDVARVPPGRFTIVAQTVLNRPPASDWEGARMVSQSIEVADRDLQNMTLVLPPNVNVPGHVLIDGHASASGGPTITFNLFSEGLQFGYSAIRLQPDGTFWFERVSPGTYRFRVNMGPRPLAIKSIRFGGDDLLTTPLNVTADLAGRRIEVEASTATATLDVIAQDAEQRPVAGALVIAVPDAARRQRSALFRTATTDANGRVHLENIEPGAYTLFATDTIEAGAWQDPEVLRRYEGRGTSVRLAESGIDSVTVKVIR